MIDYLGAAIELERTRTAERAKSEAIMNDLGIAEGDVLMRSEQTIVVVLGAADQFPRNGRGLVRCYTRYVPDGERRYTHYWPQTLAKFKRIGNVHERQEADRGD